MLRRIAALPLFIVMLLFPSVGTGQSAELPEFPDSLFNRESFFPLAVWLQAPQNAESFQKLGINLYLSLWNGPTELQLIRLKKAGMPVMAELNDVGFNSANNDIIVGWLMKDEPDNAQKTPGISIMDPPISPNEMIRRYQEIKQRDPSRPVMINLGQGVAWDQWYGRGPRTNHPEDYVEYVKAADMVSFDIYPVTHLNPEIAGRLDLVARGVDRLIKWTGGKKPVWSVIGASRIGNPDVMPTGDDIRRQVWLSIIHGATGIIYFVHQFQPVFIEAAILESEELSAAVKEINARVISLASILNSPDVIDMVKVEKVGEKDSAVDVLVKQDQCHLYIFAGSKSRENGTNTFHVKHNIIDQDIEILDESRSVQLENLSFQDAFGPYAVHLYKIDKARADCR